MKTNTITLKINSYYFDTRNQVEAEQYEALKAQLKARNLPKFKAIMGSMPFNIKGEFELNTKNIFNNQFNAGDYRLFDWAENYEIHTKYIKRGQYVEPCEGYEQLKTLRNSRKVCGYCGASYDNSNQDYCNKCLGSEYLELKELYLLKLLPISSDKDRPQDVPQYLKDDYEAAQKTARTNRLNKKIADKIKDADENIKAAKLEKKCYLWLIKHNINFDNVIYYNHIKKFCFGWRRPIENKEGLANQIKGFPAPFEIK